MYCSVCGERLNESDKYCSNCGTPLQQPISKESNNLKIISIIVGVVALLTMSSIIFAPLAIIEGIVGLILALLALKKGRNTAGIILNSVSIFLSIMIVILFVQIFISIANIIESSNYNYEYHEHI